MLDPRLIRRDPDAVRTAVARKDPRAAEALDEWLSLDTRRRELLPEVEGLRARRNEASQAIGRLKKEGGDASAAIAETKEVGEQLRAREQELAEIEERFAAVAASLPNPADPTAADEDTVLREWGVERRRATGRDHLELAGRLVDMEAGAKTSGSRFAYLKGDLVMLELALVRWTLELLRGHGFEPVIPPVLVREQALFGTGFLPDTEQQIYRLADDPLYLSGTSEVALASLHADQVIDASELPLRYAGFSPCFRREAGAAGRDTRGIFRVHQFDKVEMFAFVDPADAADEHERLLSIEEEILQQLGIPYRVVNIAADDLGGSAAKKYDCEAWMPAQEQFRELTSTSNTTDFQARRLNIRMRGEAGNQVLATLNGTAVAVGRTIIALLENHQDDDGVVHLPQVLVDAGGPATIGGSSG